MTYNERSGMPVGDDWPGPGGAWPSLSSFLRSGRLAIGMTQRDLACQAEMGLGTVRDLEQGRTCAPRPESVAALARALRVDPTQLTKLMRLSPAALPTANGGTVAFTPAGPSAPLWLEVLGSLAVWRDGKPVTLGKHQRLVLGFLAATPNVAVSREVLMDALWGEDPPRTAVSLVQSYVSRLRRALDRGRPPRSPDGLLVSTGSTYMLQAGRQHLDLIAFRELVAAAKAAPAAGQATEACTHYDRALALWRGDPLVGISRLRDHPAIVRLAQERDDAVIQYAAVAVGAGQHDRVLPHLRALAAREPLNEKAHAQLMLALAGAGQQAAALRLHADLRHRLDAELGVRPGPDVVAAQMRVLRQDTHAGTGSPAEAGAATRRSAQPARSVYQLPPDIADFVGRRLECSGLHAWLTSRPCRPAVPVAVISGPPGAGKTTLALHVAHALRPSFPDGQLFVPMSSASADRSVAEVLGELLRALLGPEAAVPDQAGERAALLRSRLADHRVLIVIDDAKSAGQIRPLLPGTAGCAVIVTSRNRIAGLAGAQLTTVDSFLPAEAVMFLSQAAGERRVLAEPEGAAELAAACGYLPLAVRIAAAKLAVRPYWPVMQLTRRIADERRRLDELAIDDLAVRASVTPSYSALDERAQRAFRRLSLLGAHDFAEWSVAALLGEPDAAVAVAALTDRSLLNQTETDGTGEPRYLVHDLLRAYAAEQLAAEPAPARDAALRRLLTGFLQLSGLATRRMPREPTLPEPGPLPAQLTIDAVAADRLTARPVEWFNAERPGLLAATQTACDAGWLWLASRLADQQLGFQDLQGRTGEAQTLWKGILTSARRAGNTRVAGHAGFRLAIIGIWRGRVTESDSLLRQHAPAFQNSGGDPEQAYYLFWRSYCAARLNQLAEARQHAESGVAIARQTDDLYAETECMRAFGLALIRLGHVGDGMKCCGEALRTARRTGNPFSESGALHGMAHGHLLSDQPQLALDLARQAVQHAESIRYTKGEVRTLTLLADCYQALGRFHEMIEVVIRADLINDRHGNQAVKAANMLRLGQAHHALSHHREAIKYLADSLPIFGELQLRQAESQARQTLRESRNASS